MQATSSTAPHSKKKKRSSSWKGASTALSGSEPLIIINNASDGKDGAKGSKGSTNIVDLLIRSGKKGEAANAQGKPHLSSSPAQSGGKNDRISPKRNRGTGSERTKQSSPSSITDAARELENLQLAGSISISTASGVVSQGQKSGGQSVRQQTAVSPKPAQTAEKSGKSISVASVGSVSSKSTARSTEVSYNKATKASHPQSSSKHSDPSLALAATPTKKAVEDRENAHPPVSTGSAQENSSQPTLSPVKRAPHYAIVEKKNPPMVAFPNAPDPTRPRVPEAGGNIAIGSAELLGLRTATPADIASYAAANDFLLTAFEETLDGQGGYIDNFGATSPIIRTLPYVTTPCSREVVHGGRVIIVGDVHGCAEQLEALLLKVHFNPEFDQLVMVGDLVNKGPDSVAVVRLCQKYKAVGVLGNHDLTLLQLCMENRMKPFTQAALRDPVKRLAITFPPDCEAYLRRLPHILRIPQYNLIVVHAGIDPRVPLEAQSVFDILHMRRIATEPVKNAKPNTISSNGVVIKGDQGVLWGQLYEGPEIVIFGHAAKSSYQQHPFAIGLDTGCVYGNSLTCICFGPMSKTGTFSAVPGLSGQANENRGLPPPESDVYEQHFLLPAEAVERSIIRPVSHLSPLGLKGTNGLPIGTAGGHSVGLAGFTYNPSAQDGMRCTPLTLNVDKVVSQFPTRSIGLNNLLSQQGGSGKPPLVRTSPSLSSKPLQSDRDGLRVASGSAPSMYSKGAGLTAFSEAPMQSVMKPKLSVLSPSHPRHGLALTILTLVKHGKFTAMVKLLSLRCYDDLIDELVEEAEEEIAARTFSLEGESPVNDFWIPVISPLLRIRTGTLDCSTLTLPFASSLEMTASDLKRDEEIESTKNRCNSGSMIAKELPDEGYTVLSRADAETLLLFALHACESLPSVGKDMNDSIKLLTLSNGNSSEKGLTVPLSIQKYAKMLLQSD